MSFTVKNVITEALARANLVARRQPAPGNMVEDALALLKGIASDYSRHNLLQFLRKEVEFPEACEPEQYILGNGYKEGVNFWFITNGQTGVLPEASAETYALGCEAWDKGGTHVCKVVKQGEHFYSWEATNYATPEEAMANLNGAIVKIIPTGIKPKMILGTVDPDIEGDYVDAVVPNIADITELYLRTASDPVANTDQPLQFVAFEDFNNADYGIYIYTWQPISDTKVELKIKPMMLRMMANRSLIMTYNVAYSFELDSVLRIPDIYKELFISALTYKLATQFPRLTPEHTERLRVTMESIEKSLKTVTRANKLVIRNEGTVGGLYNTAQLNSGSFIFPR